MVSWCVTKQLPACFHAVPLYIPQCSHSIHDTSNQYGLRKKLPKESKLCNIALASLALFPGLLCGDIKFPLFNVGEILCGDIKFPLFNVGEILCGDTKFPLSNIGEILCGDTKFPLSNIGEILCGDINFP